MEGAAPIERELCRIEACHVFKVPPRTGAAGYRASEWGEQIKVVQLRVLEKGSQCMIALFDPATGGLYARCPLREGAVERATDSTRYFVLRVPIQQGKYAFLGVAFKTRDEAFDFNVALSDHQKNIEREQKLANNESLFEVEESRDFSIQEGQKIHINIGGTGRKPRAKKASNLLGATNDGAPRGGGFLAPPPSDTPSRSGALPAPRPVPKPVPEPAATPVPAAVPAAAPAPAAAAPAGDGSDLLNFSADNGAAAAAAGGLDDFSSLNDNLPTLGAVEPAAAPAASADPFGGSTDPFGGGAAAAQPAPAAASDPFGGAGSDPFGAPSQSGATAAAPAAVPFGGPADPFGGAAPAAAPKPVAVAVDPFGGGPAPAAAPAPAPAPVDPFGGGNVMMPAAPAAPIAASGMGGMGLGGIGGMGAPAGGYGMGGMGGGDPFAAISAPPPTQQGYQQRQAGAVRQAAPPARDPFGDLTGF